MGGQQGEGIESCGEIMATILAKEGYSLYSQRLFASRIKGGHTTFALRVALEQVMSIGEGVDFLLSLDQETEDILLSSLNNSDLILPATTLYDFLFFIIKLLLKRYVPTLYFRSSLNTFII